MSEPHVPLDVADYLSRLSDPDSEIRSAARRKLQEFVIQARQLLRLLTDDRVPVREYAIDTLSMVELRGRAYPELENALLNGCAYVQVLAAQILWRAPRLDPKPPVESLLSILMDGLVDTDYRVRFHACRTLCMMGQQASPSISRILELKTDPSFLVRLQVVQATYLIGASPEAAIPLLNDLMNDEHGAVRACAASALEKFIPNLSG